MSRFKRRQMHMDAVRALELERALAFFPPPPAKVLEIGGGTGHQASILTERGYDVLSVDLPASEYAQRRKFPIVDYDGVHLPAGDAVFDCVFSSNVLEHIAALETPFEEMRRVLKPRGLAIHILPTPAWRMWTSLTYYPDRFIAAARFATKTQIDEPSAPASDPSRTGRRGDLSRWLGSIVRGPPRHGERGNTITEAFWFSREFWLPAFEHHGFELVHEAPLGIFYTGYSVLDSALAVSARERVARILGSATHLYVLRRAP